MNQAAAKPEPTPRWIRPIAWGLFSAFVLLVGATVGLVIAGNLARDQMLVVLVFGYAIVGALVATREPQNSVGWLLLGIASSLAVQGFVESYVAVAGRPGTVTLAWIGTWAWRWWLGLTALLALVFPDGRVLSRHWRPALWIAIASLALSIVYEGLRAGPLRIAGAPIQNPYGIGGAGEPVIDAIALLANLLTAAGLALGVVSMAFRLRRSRGRERQQVKWVVYVGGLGLCSLGLAMLSMMADELSGGNKPAWAVIVGTIGWNAAPWLIGVGLPLTIGTAMLRHRLYDIDLVIKRTLVYGALTLMLAAVYLTLVLGLRTLLNPVTGESDLAVAASTLAVAALFRPLRTRIQTLVDRRFYRARYDATQAADAFTAQLRQEVDLDAVTTDLLSVVRETLQPEHATLWLKGR
jgi:hypothetical protein